MANQPATIRLPKLNTKIRVAGSGSSGEGSIGPMLPSAR